MKQRYLPELIGAVLLTGVLAATLSGSDDAGSIGPVDSVTFAGADGDLTLKNSDKHLSWGKEKTSTAWSLGFMDVNKALNQLMKADYFVDARRDLDEELEEQMKNIRKVLESIMEEGRSLESDDPNTAEVRQRWEQAYKEFQLMQQKGAEIRGALYSNQIKEAFEEIVEAVNVVAEGMNIDMVIQFIPHDDEFETGNPDSTITQIRLRTALRIPEGVDITDDVLSELGLESQ